jgi:uncharacterized protein (UPF0276 family)
MIPIGFTLQPDEAYLELCAGLIRDEADYLEIAPETTWRPDAAGALVENGFHTWFRAILAETRKPCVAHGVGFSVGSARPDARRRAAWLARLALDQAQLGYRWYTDHLGASELDGRDLVLPLPLPYTAEARARVVASLRAMRTVVPDVGVENSVFYFHLGRPLDEPRWLAAALEEADAHLLLDLHNVHTTALNAGFEAWEYVRRLPLERVIEVHLSGGADSDPRWLASGRVLRLDGHDAAVPEEVWRLFERVLPQLPNLRGVTLERMEGTVAQADVALLRDELHRARRIVEGVHVR